MGSMAMKNIVRDVIETATGRIVQCSRKRRPIIMVEINQQPIDNVDSILIISIRELDTKI
jgi:hypothetical protein